MPLGEFPELIINCYNNGEVVSKLNITEVPEYEFSPTYSHFVGFLKGCHCYIDKNYAEEILDKSAEFPGGWKEYERFRLKNLRYPQIDECWVGRVVATFVVELDGSISNIEIKVPMHPEHNKEAERFIKSMPRWKPAKKEG